MDDQIAQWKAAGENGDVHAALNALSPDAELVSPLTDQFVFRGREATGQLLAGVFTTLDDFTYTSDLRQADAAVLTATSRASGVALHETQHLEIDRSGTISRLTVSIRPLPALTCLDRLAATGDKRFVPMAAPPQERR
ncbi:MAG TPA: hypothetical protein VK060_09485 [Ruania sp.]|nr:hypothetical protein [Ruania sp.]